MGKVKKRTLLLIAGIVWFLAGFNIARIGFAEYANYLRVLNVVLSVVIFCLFGMMFFKIHKKHVKRILGYEEEKKLFLLFFDGKAWILMAFMMGLGLVLRYGKLAPMSFIAVFYTGLGSALMLAGVLFFAAWIRAGKAPAQKKD